MKAIKINRILVPTDFSKTADLATQHACFMARLFKADLYLLHAFEMPEVLYHNYNPTILIDDIEEMKNVAERKLKEAATDIRKKYSITVKTICSTGRPAINIQEVIESKNIDLVVMGTHGAYGFNEMLIGSNAQRTVMFATCPVITIQTKSKKLGFNSIVLPIDDEFYSRQKVDHAVTLAKNYGAKVHVLGLMEKGSDFDEKKFKIKIDSVTNMLKREGINFDSKTVVGDNLAIAAMRYSKKVKGDLILVLSDHESNMSGAFLNTFAKQIVNHSKIPVMTIKQRVGDYDLVPLRGSSSV